MVKLLLDLFCDQRPPPGTDPFFDALEQLSPIIWFAGSQGIELNLDWITFWRAQVTLSETDAVIMRFRFPDFFIDPPIPQEVSIYDMGYKSCIL